MCIRDRDKLTYVTGSHYMYLQWSKIDVGAADYRESNRLFFIFWEACKADQRCYGMCYLKNRRSGFSFMASGETVNQATISSDARFGILSKSGGDAKKMFTDKVVPISVNIFLASPPPSKHLSLIHISEPTRPY